MINERSINKRSKEAYLFQESLQHRINSFNTSPLPIGTESRARFFKNEKRPVEGYRSSDLSDPKELIAFFFTLTNLPAEFLPQVTTLFMKDVVSWLQENAEVVFDPSTGEVLVAGFLVAEIPERHAAVLKHLLEQKPGEYMTTNEMLMGSDGTHALVTLKLFLKKLNLTAAFEGFSPLYPFELIDQEIKGVDPSGRPCKSWGYCLTSSFSHFRLSTSS